MVFATHQYHGPTVACRDVSKRILIRGSIGLCFRVSKTKLLMIVRDGLFYLQRVQDP